MDGRASAAVIERKHKNSQFVAMNYGDELPDLKDKKVYIVDFSFPAEVMQTIREKAADVVWLDHHATSVAIQEKLGWGTIKNEECGATLTWKTLFPEEELPSILTYIRDKDLWIWKEKDSRAVSESLADMFRGDDFSGLLSTNPNDLVDKGRLLLARKHERVLAACARGFTTQLNGSSAFAVNSDKDASDIGDHINAKIGFPVAVMFHFNGKVWVYGLRSLSVDVSAIAQKYGGGGHKQAAGFSSPDLVLTMPGKGQEA